MGAPYHGGMGYTLIMGDRVYHLSGKNRRVYLSSEGVERYLINFLLFNKLYYNMAIKQYIEIRNTLH